MLNSVEAMDSIEERSQFYNDQRIGHVLSNIDNNVEKASHLLHSGIQRHRNTVSSPLMTV